MDRVVKLEQIEHFDFITDVAVCGYGGAGASAALEARRAGSEVMIFERFSSGGGSTALSACEMYLGGNGGTKLQQELGFEDSTENFYNYLMACFGKYADEARVRKFVDGAAEHFDWAEGLGVPYKRAFYPGRDVVAMTGDSLQYTGNERAYPFNQQAQAIPRGHLPADADHDGGKVLMGHLMRNVVESEADIKYDARVLSLIQDENKRICGLLVKIDNKVQAVYARQGVILAMGGFIMNESMTKQHIPQLESICTRHGNPGDRGDGILMGIAAGGNAIHMGQAFVGIAHYPPSDLTYGIFVNEQGQRFINEDIYLARMGDYAARQTKQKAYMFIDNKYYSRPDYHETTEIIAVGETVEELERESGLPEGSLQHTVAYYNQHAEQGVDPLFHKSADWLAPLVTPPFALVDYSLATLKPTCFTLGGLDTLPTGEVLSAEREVIEGLYAAGRTASGIPRTGEGYASGMSVADATFFGRQAGITASQTSRNEPPV